MRLRLPDRGPVDYQVERHNEQWRDHVLRSRITASLVSWLRPSSIIDPACGDGSIALLAHAGFPMERAYLADISEPNIASVSMVRSGLPMQLEMSVQPAEVTLAEPGRYDIAILTEILEHVEDPVTLLRLARDRAHNIVVSSPLIEEGWLDDNEEHLWQFDTLGYQEILEEAGWSDVIAYVPIHLPKFKYDFQIWAVQ